MVLSISCPLLHIQSPKVVKWEYMCAKSPILVEISLKKFKSCSVFFYFWWGKEGMKSLVEKFLQAITCRNKLLYRCYNISKVNALLIFPSPQRSNGYFFFKITILNMQHSQWCGLADRAHSFHARGLRFHSWYQICQHSAPFSCCLFLSVYLSVHLLSLFYVHSKIDHLK